MTNKTFNKYLFNNKESIINDIELVISVIGDSLKINSEIKKTTEDVEEMANEFNLPVKMY